MHFKIDWASLIVGSKFTIFALFYFVFEGNFPSTRPRGAYIWRGDLTESFLPTSSPGRFSLGTRLVFCVTGLAGGRGELIHGGAYFRTCTVG